MGKPLYRANLTGANLIKTHTLHVFFQSGNISNLDERLQSELTK